MTLKPRLPEAQADEIPRELLEMGHKIAQLPAGQRAEMERCYQQVVDGVRRRRRILRLVQEALAQLRLDIKYLMFDLEVTRQERDVLREQLNDD